MKDLRPLLDTRVELYRKLERLNEHLGRVQDKIEEVRALIAVIDKEVDRHKPGGSDCE